MNNNNDISIVNSNVNNQYICPNCKAELIKSTKETKFFSYYKCPDCNKTFRQKKKLDSDEVVLLIGEQLQKAKEAIYCLTFIVAIWFIISFIYYITHP